ncbi:hypothetical protein NPIL_269521, partial [Nephila pilipes]
MVRFARLSSARAKTGRGETQPKERISGQGVDRKSV